MALLTGNISSASKALNNKLNSNPLNNLSQLNLSNLGKPSVQGVTNKNVIPSNIGINAQGKVSTATTKAPAKPAATTIYSAPTTQTTTASNPVYDKAVQLADMKGKLATLQEELKQQKEIEKEQKKIAQEKANAPKFSGVLQDLIKRASDSSGIEKAYNNLAQFRTMTSEKIADIKSDPIPLEFQQGRAQVVQQAAAEQERALAQGVENALQARAQDINALTSAAELAQPVQLPYGMQYVNPVTGDLIGGGSLGGGLNVPSIAQQVVNGQLTPSQAESMLGNNLGLLS